MRHAIKSALSLLFVLALAAAPAIAKDHGRGHDRDRDDYRHGYDRSDRDDHRYSRGDDDDRRKYRYSKNDRRYNHDRYYQQRPRVVYRPVYRPVYGPAYHVGHGAPRWARGYRYNRDGYGPTYIVNDYRGYGLRAPPRGQYWRRSDAGDYLLVAVATGLITDLILRN